MANGNDDWSSFYNPEPGQYKRNYYPGTNEQEEIRTGRTSRSQFLDDITDGLKEVENYNTRITSLSNQYSKILNDQVDILAKITRAQTVDQERAAKAQLEQANKYANEQLNIIKRSYAKQKKFLDDETKRRYRENIRGAEANARQVLETVRKVDKDLFAELNKSSNATFQGKFTEFAKSLSDAYTRFNVNQFVTNAMDRAQSNTTVRDSIGRTNSLTKDQTRQISQQAAQYATNTYNSQLTSKDIMSNAETAANYTGSRNAKDIASVSKILTDRDTLGLTGDLTKTTSAVRSMGGDLNSFMEDLTKQQVSLAKSTDLKYNQATLVQQLDQLQPGLSANVTDPNQLLKNNKSASSVLASLQDQSPEMGDAVFQMLQTALNDPTSAQKLGISNMQLTQALSKGDGKQVLDMLFSASSRISNSSNPLAVGSMLNLDASQVNALKGVTKNKDNILSSYEEAQNAKQVDPSKVISDGDYTRAGIFKFARPLFEKFSNVGEGISDMLGVDPKDVNSQLTTIINLMYAIVGSDLIKKGASLFGLDGMGSKLAGNIATKIFGSGGAHAAGGASKGILSSLAGIGGKGAASAGGLGSKAFSLFGKIGGPLAIGSAIFDGILGASKSEKILGTADGRKISGKIAAGLGTALGGSGNNGKGGILSALGQGAKGAAIGTMIAPGIGTAIGGVVGGVFGLIGSDKLAKMSNGIIKATKKYMNKVGDWLGGLWDDIKDNKTTGGISKWYEKNIAGDKGKDAKSASKGFFEGLLSGGVQNGITNAGIQWLLSKFNVGSRIAKWFDKGSEKENKKRVEGTKKHSHKDGLDRVPKDEYYATLHKDEAVLTASQAEQWRQQQRGNSVSKFMANAFKNAEYTPASKTIKGAKTTVEKVDDTDSTANVSAGNGDKLSIWKAIRSLGYSKAATAGVFANAAAETGDTFDAGIIQGNGAGPAAGLFQWENYNTKSGRWKSMADYASSKGGKWNNPAMQVQWMDEEMRGKDPTTKALLGSYVGGYDKFKQLTDVGTATTVFLRSFERAGVEALGKRLDYGNKYYDQFSKYKQGTPWVPDDQLALIHKGEMIVPEEHNPNNPKNLAKSMTKVDNTNTVQNLATTTSQDLKDLLTWGFNKVVEAINNQGQTSPLSKPNIPASNLIRS